MLRRDRFSVKEMHFLKIVTCDTSIYTINHPGLIVSKFMECLRRVKAHFFCQQVLIATVIGWLVSAILTMSGVFSSDPKATDFYARTDSRLFIVKDTDWFIFPYPGMRLIRLCFSINLNLKKSFSFVLIQNICFIHLFVFFKLWKTG